MKLPVIIDPRRFDAVIVDAEAATDDYDSAAALVNKLTDAGVATAVYSSDKQCCRTRRVVRCVCRRQAHQDIAPLRCRDFARGRATTEDGARAVGCCRDGRGGC